MDFTWKHMAFFLAGGLGLFLIGMEMMSDGLKEAAGQKLKKILESMTANPLMGFMTGLLVTSLIQSSSATSVMVLGLINAGLLNLGQAISVVFGANVGTTVTAWIVSLMGFEFDLAAYAFPAVAIGFLVRTLAKSRKTKSIGQITIGFAILLIGIGVMKDAFGGLEENARIVALLASFGGQPLLSLLMGMGLTLLIQSSSAAIAIIQVMAINGALGDDWVNVLNVVIPFVLGCDIGTTITAQLASLRTNIWGKRTAWAHTLFNVFGTALAMPFVYSGHFAKVVLWLSCWELGSTTIALSIAVANTLFKAGCSALFLPLVHQVEKLVIWLIPSRPGDPVGIPIILEERLLNTPALALEQAKREILRMTQEARRSLQCAIDALLNGDAKQIKMTCKLEDRVDEFQFQITSYLVALSERQLSEEVSRELPVLLHMVNDLERVGDHAVNISEIAERKLDIKFTFTDFAKSEGDEMIREAFAMFDNILSSLEKEDIQAAHRALLNEGNLNRMQLRFRRSHVQRMTDGICTAESGLIFIDVVDNLEKIGDHLTNIAESIIGGVQWTGVKSSSLSGEFKALTNE